MDKLKLIYCFVPPLLCYFMIKTYLNNIETQMINLNHIEGSVLLREHINTRVIDTIVNFII